MRYVVVVVVVAVVVVVVVVVVVIVAVVVFWRGTEKRSHKFLSSRFMLPAPCLGR